MASSHHFGDKKEIAGLECDKQLNSCAREHSIHKAVDRKFAARLRNN